MKKALFLSVLLLAIFSSVLSGTLAGYTVALSQLSDGSVVSDEFTFVKDGTDSFEEQIKIAPGETVSWQFAIKNFSDTTVSETDLYYILTFTLSEAAGKSPIEPLVTVVKTQDGDEISRISGTGAMQTAGSFSGACRQSSSFIVEISWPSNNSVDMNYMGNEFGTAIRVSAAASQTPPKDILIADSSCGYLPIKGSWNMAEEGLSPLYDGEHRAILNHSAGSDYEIIADATLLEGDGYGIFYRATAGTQGRITGYCFEFNRGAGDKFMVRHFISGKEYSLNNGIRMKTVFGNSFSKNGRHRIKISVIANRHKIYVDGVQVLNFTDSLYSEGSVGVRTWGSAKAMCHSLSVIQNTYIKGTDDT